MANDVKPSIINAKIKMVCQQVKEFVEQDTPIEVTHHYSTDSDIEIAKKYRELINYYNILQNHLKNMDYLIYVLSEAQLEIDNNRPDSSKRGSSISKQVDVLKILRDTLKGMDRGMYHTLRYYERISG